MLFILQLFSLLVCLSCKERYYINYPNGPGVDVVVLSDVKKSTLCKIAIQSRGANEVAKNFSVRLTSEGSPAVSCTGCDNLTLTVGKIKTLSLTAGSINDSVIKNRTVYLKPQLLPDHNADVSLTNLSIIVLDNRSKFGFFIVSLATPLMQIQGLVIVYKAFAVSRGLSPPRLV